MVLKKIPFLGFLNILLKHKAKAFFITINIIKSKLQYA